MAYSHFQDAIYPQVHYVDQSPRDGPPDGCYVFVMFPTYHGTNIHEVGKSCVLARRTLGTSGGRFIGIARKVFSYGFETRTEEACIVFHFSNRQAAKSFFESDPHFKQPDFPPSAGHCQAWAIDRHYTPDNEPAYNTFMISEIRLRRPDANYEYKREYATPFADLLLSHNAQPYVVQTSECLGLRRFCKDPEHIVTVHLFRSPKNLGDVMNDPRFEDLDRIHSKLAFEMRTVFTIDPRPCP